MTTKENAQILQCHAHYRMHFQLTNYNRKHILCRSSSDTDGTKYTSVASLVYIIVAIKKQEINNVIMISLKLLNMYISN